MAELDLIVIREGNAPERHRLTEAGLVIGRNPENEVPLPYKQISRRHARIWIHNGVVKIEDLESRNGIEVNGARVKLSVLNTGDKIQIGPAALQICEATDSAFERTLISAEHAKVLHESILSGKDLQRDRLPVLYRAAQLLGTVFDLDDLLHQILELTFEALPVRRGYILTVNGESGLPEIRAEREDDEVSDRGAPVSQTMIHHVFDTRGSILTMDAQDDSRFDCADSILGHDIHAAMCAPLCGREAIVGAIYVDGDPEQRSFAKADLELLTAIAQVVGVAVENARLYQEKVEGERLAAIGEATAGLGHCVKNILTGIRGGSEFIDMAIKEKELRYVERGWPIMSRAIERIDLLVNNMLTFSRERVPERVMTDLRHTVEDVAETVRARAEKYNVIFTFDFCEDNRLAVDPREIYRAVLNLVINAVEACEHNGGAITVSTIKDENGFTLTVRDTGIGIPPDMLPRLAKAFVSSKGSSGTGLGLACTYKIAKEHGGHVDVESEVGKGTAFTLFLPHPETLPGNLIGFSKPD
ncbi:MAG: FHA domain-containing protein [Candidatus Hydrogenedentes bacterium]|nr:FHA domain-containing protein [Candidatus Hydrogenedentota bacterium]